MTTVQFDAPVELSDAADAEVSRWYLEHNKQGATRVRVYSLNFGRHNRDAQEDNHLPSPPRFLALVSESTQKQELGQAMLINLDSMNLPIKRMRTDS